MTRSLKPGKKIDLTQMVAEATATALPAETYGSNFLEMLRGTDPAVVEARSGNWQDDRFAFKSEENGYILWFSTWENATTGEFYGLKAYLALPVGGPIAAIADMVILFGKKDQTMAQKMAAAKADPKRALTVKIGNQFPNKEVNGKWYPVVIFDNEMIMRMIENAEPTK